MTGTTTTAFDQRPNSTQPMQAEGDPITRSAVFVTGMTVSDGGVGGEYDKREKRDTP
jgi:hypothetical protein